MPRPPRYMDPAALPPMPDVRTGLPRPPRAPGGASGTPARLDRTRVSDPALAPQPPPEQGPVLAWYRATRGYAVQVGLVGVLITGVLVWLRTGLRVAWLGYWQVWVGLAVIGLLIGLSQRRAAVCSAGVAWVRGRKSWVCTYELVSVKWYPSLSGGWVGLVDRDGRRLTIDLSTLRQDRRLWDLVYNGILHSAVAGGADTNGAAHLNLRLPYPSPYS